MSQTLSALEQRVLGVLIEKSLTQPDQYPLSLNALVLGCNQKQNRDPVMAVSEHDVAETLTYLMVRGMAIEINPGRGGRVKKYRHESFSHFGWQTRSSAVMAELLLRGPQTVGELRTRCSRMVRFDGIETVAVELDRLARHDPPFTEALPREPGKSAVRHRHTLDSEDSPQESRDDAAAVPEQAATTPDREPPVVSEPENTSLDTAAYLQSQIDELQREVAQLTSRLDELDRTKDRSEA